jgi:hypothetical protein
MKLYELILDNSEDADSGVFALSLVQNPAIEANWVYFSKEGKAQIQFATIDNDKRTIVAPVLIPDLQILRIDSDTGEEYKVYFTKETVEQLAQKYLKDGYQNKATYEHSETIDGDVTVVESWVSKSATKDKSALYFNRSFPVGTWFVTMRVNDEKLWQEYVKTGVVKAISLEGIFDHKLVKASKVESIMEKEIDELTEEEATIVLSKIKEVLFESYSDYGDGIRNNAKRGIELNDKVGNKCATQVGKVRAQQLADGEAISVETIQRMYSYLSRAETYYDESDTEACGTISYLLWGGKAALAWSRNKLRELGLLEEMEQPSVASTYPGEAASGSIAPALLAEGCPPATQNVAINLYNRSIAIKQANYGPLNPNEPNDAYWEAKAGEFGGSVEEAKTALCGNCAFFDVRKQTLDCIAEGIGYEDDPEKVIEAGELGYCEAFDFKCAAKRTCSAWVVGGPIKD